jgi:hypothetical protein
LGHPREKELFLLLGSDFFHGGILLCLRLKFYYHTATSLAQDILSVKHNVTNDHYAHSFYDENTSRTAYCATWV